MLDFIYGVAIGIAIAVTIMGPLYWYRKRV